jgi:hypothetical protein
MDDNNSYINSIINSYEKDLKNAQRTLKEQYNDEYSCLETIKFQTTEICLAAVKIDGWHLEFVVKQTPKIVLAAVKQNGRALQYVIKQTRDICITALRQEEDSFRYIRDPNMKLQIVLELFEKYKHLDYSSKEIQFCIARMKEL